MKRNITLTCLLIISLFLASSCNQGSGASVSTSVSDKGVVVIDMNRLMKGSPYLATINDPNKVKKDQEDFDQFTAQLQNGLQKMAEDLKLIADKNSDDYRSKLEEHQYKLMPLQKKMIDMSMRQVNEQMKAIDETYQVVQKVALSVAKKMGAKVVLHKEDLPQPSTKIQYPNQLVRHPGAMATNAYEKYMTQIARRKVIASDITIDITNKVLNALRKDKRWKQ